MTTIVTMPEVAETVVEGTIARWLKKEGERVEQYEPLVEVVTDKVNIEVPSPVAGVLSRIVAQPDTTVPVGAELARIEEEASSPALPATGEEGGPKVAPPSLVGSSADVAAVIPARPGGPRLSPLVRRLAERHQVDVGGVKGTGLGGRVRKQDILDYVARRALPPVAAPAPPSVAAAPGDVEVPLTPVRAIIARRMAQAKREVPHAWTTLRADVSGLVMLREAAKDRFRATEGVPLTYLPFFIKAVVGALKEHPGLNSSWAGDKIILKKEINIGIAVDREEGLIVPVVRHADAKSIAGLARELHGLIERARANKLRVEDIQGGTFTVNNTGSFGAVVSMPIVNQPQAAILATEAIVKQPVVVAGDAIAVRSIMHISISFDHRVVDGGQVGRFMQAVKRNLESYGPDTPVY